MFDVAAADGEMGRGLTDVVVVAGRCSCSVCVVVVVADVAGEDRGLNDVAAVADLLLCCSARAVDAVVGDVVDVDGWGPVLIDAAVVVGSMVCPADAAVAVGA